MKKQSALSGIFILLVLASCKKEETPIQDNAFELKYSSDGMIGVNAQFGLNEKSQTDPTKGSDILVSKLDANTNSKGSLTGSAKYHTGDKIYAYVQFNDITSLTAVPPAGNGFLASAIYINSISCGSLRLNYYDYYYSPQKRYVDSKGKTNLLIESVITIP